MTKTWECEQCGHHESRKLLTSLINGGPDECIQCGKTEFTETTLGIIHPMID